MRTNSTCGKYLTTTYICIRFVRIYKFNLFCKTKQFYYLTFGSKKYGQKISHTFRLGCLVCYQSQYYYFTVYKCFMFSQNREKIKMKCLIRSKNRRITIYKYAIYAYRWSINGKSYKLYTRRIGHNIIYQPKRTINYGTPIFTSRYFKNINLVFANHNPPKHYHFLIWLSSYYSDK